MDLGREKKASVPAFSCAGRTVLAFSTSAVLPREARPTVLRRSFSTLCEVSRAKEIRLLILNT